jgi:hypothetical protein
MMVLNTATMPLPALFALTRKIRFINAGFISSSNLIGYIVMVPAPKKTDA